MFTDVDFKDRTVLNLICHNTYDALLSDGKVTALLDSLWQGELTNQCDGRISDYSKLTHMATTEITKLKGQKISFKTVLSWNFKYDITKESHTVQYLFRKSSIAIIFQKNFYSAIIIVVIFTMINIRYQELFTANLTVKMTEEEKIKKYAESLQEFNNYTMVGQITSFSCMMSVCGQLIFNKFSQHKFPFDKWAVLDFFNAITNNICFGMFLTLKAEGITD